MNAWAKTLITTYKLILLFAWQLSDLPDTSELSFSSTDLVINSGFCFLLEGKGSIINSKLEIHNMKIYLGIKYFCMVPASVVAFFFSK